MHWLQSEVKPYCERVGIHLMRDDIRFIEKRLSEISRDEHRRIMRQYVRIWKQAIDEGKGQNKGRCLANEYIRGED